VASRFRVLLVSIAFALCLLALLLVTLTPTPVDQPFEKLLTRLISELHERGLPRMIGYGEIEFGANVAMFVPIGFLTALLLPRRFAWVAILVGPLLSAVVETTQLVFLPARYASVLDVVANSAGSLLGVGIAAALRRAVAHRDRLVMEDVRAGLRNS
jgi:glycopeptide antibiotics resistance protein